MTVIIVNLIYNRNIYLSIRFSHQNNLQKVFNILYSTYETTIYQLMIRGTPSITSL